MGVIRKKSEVIESLYLFYLLRSFKFNEYLGKAISGANINNLNSTILSVYKIPLPPLEVQRKIILQPDNYQKIIDGAKQIVDNYKPEIRIDPDWEIVELGNVATMFSKIKSLR